MNKKILVVDDSRLELRILVDMLSEEGYIVFACTNGYDALDLANRIKPDVILLNIIMPGLDGFEVCDLLKKKDDMKDIPIIMITSKTDSKDIKKALELGAFDYLKKPIDEVELFARINSALRCKEYQEKLKEMAMRDGLTGLYNHSLLIELFEKKCKGMKVKDNGIAFAMLDIDFYKKVNDIYGHAFGDRVLKEISSILINCVRSSDIVGRYGGEEFGVVFADTDLEEVQRICEHIRKKIEEHDFNIDGKFVKVTLSIGVNYSLPGKNALSSEMIQRADEALYKAKNSGRNKVEVNIGHGL